MLLISLIAICFLESAIFVIFYGLRSPWKFTSMGRHLMCFGLTLTSLLGLNLWSIIITPLPIFVWDIGLLLFAVMLGWRVQLMFKAQRNRVS